MAGGATAGLGGSVMEGPGGVVATASVAGAPSAPSNRKCSCQTKPVCPSGVRTAYQPLRSPSMVTAVPSSTQVRSLVSLLGPSRSRARLLSVTAPLRLAVSATAASTIQPSFRSERRPTVVAPSSYPDLWPAPTVERRVGVTGFEPATPASRTQCSSQAEPHPVRPRSTSGPALNTRVSEREGSRRAKTPRCAGMLRARARSVQPREKPRGMQLALRPVT